MSSARCTVRADGTSSGAGTGPCDRAGPRRTAGRPPAAAGRRCRAGELPRARRIAGPADAAEEPARLAQPRGGGRRVGRFAAATQPRHPLRGRHEQVQNAVSRATTTWSEERVIAGAAAATADDVTARRPMPGPSGRAVGPEPGGFGRLPHGHVACMGRRGAIAMLGWAALAAAVAGLYRVARRMP